MAAEDKSAMHHLNEFIQHEGTALDAHHQALLGAQRSEEDEVVAQAGLNLGNVI